ncbi:MAG: DUF559 domain-containing protein [Fibromonadaceae bacterium]|nr:DUF559 domain-containing protein [Fibromonadaceae bacterium]
MIFISYNAKLCMRAAKLRKAGILSEVLLWNQIKQKRINGLDFDRQRVIGNYIADFCCSDTGVIIEIDGYTHDYKLEYDMHRESYIKALGLETIHIPDKDIKQGIEVVVNMLLSHPLLQEPIPERKCIFLAQRRSHPAFGTPPRRGIIP